MVCADQASDLGDGQAGGLELVGQLVLFFGERWRA
jgi:hypothetical protein